jgi:hypothetical protein
MAIKIEPTSNSRPHAHFTEHLMCVTENPPPRAPRESKKTRVLDPVTQE